MRMFRYMLAYSRDRSASGKAARYKKKMGNILDTLNACLADVQPTKLFFSGRTHCSNIVSQYWTYLLIKNNN